MSATIARFATLDPTVCCVCRRRAMALGYTPSQRRPTIWLCDDKYCHQVARKVYAMPAEKLDIYELVAMRHGGEQGGSYLDEIDKTDLTRLAAEEWDEFLRRVLVGYEQELRRKLLAHEAPF